MKKKSLNAKKKIHNFLLKKLNNTKINNIYSIFKDSVKYLINKKTQAIAVAVSGGPDSLALSYLAKCYSLENKIKVYFYLVNHKLRKNSSKEALLVKSILKKFNINCKILVWSGSKPISNIQSIARFNRYLLLDKRCKKDKVKLILVGHHEDDLFENFFIRLTRGSGLNGLTSFNRATTKLNKNLNLCRPLIDINKSELIYISKKIFNFYIDDPSNEEMLFKRIRFRKLIKHLKSEGLDYKKLRLTINNLSDSNNTVDYYVNKNINLNTSYLKKRSAIILTESFFHEPSEVVFRSFSKILKEIGKKYYSPRGKNINLILSKIKTKNFKKGTLGGCILEKYYNSVIISKESVKIS